MSDRASRDANEGSSQPQWSLAEPRSAYLHIPFCRHRCGYCNFSVVAGRDDLAKRMLDAIDTELASLQRPRLETLFVGGGTPTHLSVGQLDRLLTILDRRFSFAADSERTVEANPEDITKDKVDLLADRGINRISLGVQSFDSTKLAALERGHSGADAIRAVHQVAQRIDNVSVDLIFAAPGETLAVWESDLATAHELPISHLSTYTLTYEQGTAFWSRLRRGAIDKADEELEIDMYLAACRAATERGWEQYEISSFAKLGRRCRHNLGYWLGRGWHAAGPGAARFVGGQRSVNHRSPFTYLRRIESGDDPVAEVDRLTAHQYARERLAFGVRMIDGVELDQVSQQTGVDVSSLCRHPIQRIVSRGWVEAIDHRLRLTEAGLLFADAVAAELLSDD